MGWKESNEVEVMEIKAAQTTLKEISAGRLIIESDSIQPNGCLTMERSQAAIYYDNMVI